MCVCEVSLIANIKQYGDDSVRRGAGMGVYYLAQYIYVVGCEIGQSAKHTMHSSSGKGLPGRDAAGIEVIISVGLANSF